jgi:hypothetical protein
MWIHTNLSRLLPVKDLRFELRDSNCRPQGQCGKFRAIAETLHLRHQDDGANVTMHLCRSCNDVQVMIAMAKSLDKVWFRDQCRHRSGTGPTGKAPLLCNDAEPVDQMLGPTTSLTALWNMLQIHVALCSTATTWLLCAQGEVRRSK